jgi:hypothetical protein
MALHCLQDPRRNSAEAVRIQASKNGNDWQQEMTQLPVASSKTLPSKQKE